MPTLRELVDRDDIDMDEVQAHLDGLEPTIRIEESCSLGRRHQSRLFEAASQFRPISLDHLVARAEAPMTEVVHHGRNTLPAFSRFAKVFARPSDESDARLFGYNRAGGFVETVVGPGYFVARSLPEDGEVLVDYLAVPPEHPPEWPPILPNSARLSRFVYNGTQDVLRGVSRHVTIGRAFKGDKPLSAWFVLCREDG